MSVAEVAPAARAAIKGWGVAAIKALLMRLVDPQLSFPSILVALMLMAAFGRGIDKVIIALIVVQWAYYARTVRGTALSETRNDYIDAARGLGLPARRFLCKHLPPNRKLYMSEATREPNPGYGALQSTFIDLSNHLAASVSAQVESVHS